MVYKPPERMKLAFEGPCEKLQSTKRLISIGASVEQRFWKPTLRRRRIAAECIHGKPSYKTIPPYLGPHVVDSNKKSAPAYSLGRSIPRKYGHFEDGPAKFNLCGLHRKGTHTAPAYTMKSRRPDLKKFQAPPATKYFIDEALKATTKTTPTYTFGKRPVVIKTASTPAPNVYNLPPVFGTAKEGKIKAAPAFSMLGRAKPREYPISIFPGPGDYENTYRYAQKVSPRFTIRSKHKIINDEHMKPGPADHCPEMFFKHKSVPAPTFSIKHTPYLGRRKAYLMQEPKPSSKCEWIL